MVKNKNRKKNYPLYETTVFEDFRIMTENVAKKYPDRIAISYKDKPSDKETKTITFAKARELVRAIGQGCVDLGLREEKVLIAGKAAWGWVLSYYALMSVGAVTVPVDKESSLADLSGIAQKTECKAVFYSDDIAEKIAELKGMIPTASVWVCISGKPFEGDLSIEDVIAKGNASFAEGKNDYDTYDLDPDKVATIVFTSGTTGKGKGVMLSQTNIVSDMTQGMYNFDITPKTMCVLPPHHTFGSTVNFVGHFSQGSEVYLSSGIKYFLREIQEQQPSHMILVPLFLETLYKRIWATAEKEGKDKILRTMMKVSNALLKVGIDLRRKFFGSIHKMLGGKLELIICGGAALNQSIIDFFEGIGIVILNGYGITECAPLISANRNLYRKTGSVGTPIVGGLVKIKDPDENGEGEICYKGPNVMKGYYKEEEATAAVFDEEGYFMTGDYGKLDEEGWIYITGRKKNLIIFSNGKNVYPEEIEAVMSGIYGIGELVVYAGESKSDSSKEAIVLEIFPDAEALAARNITDAKAYFEEQVKIKNEELLSFKRVHIVKLRDVEFEKNTSRKIMRFKIDKTID